MLKSQIRCAVVLLVVASFVLVPTTALARPFAPAPSIEAPATGLVTVWDAVRFHVGLLLGVTTKATSTSPEPSPLEAGAGFDPFG